MVTHKQIIRITEGEHGSSVLHMREGAMSVMTPAWVKANRPEVGGYLIDNGRGDVWFAANSLSNLPAVLVEVQRVAPKPGELILFKLPKDAAPEDGATLGEFVRQCAPNLPFVVVLGELEVVAISASDAQALRSAAPDDLVPL